MIDGPENPRDADRIITSQHIPESAHPPTLNYAQPSGKTSAACIVGTSCIFGLAFELTEILTLYAWFYRPYLQPGPVASLTEGHVAGNFWSSVVDETMYGFCAFVVVMLAQFILPRRGPRLESPRLWWLGAVLSGVGFSWTRWLIYLLSKRIPFEFPDFWTAMALAAAVGVLLAQGRHRRGRGPVPVDRDA